MKNRIILLPFAATFLLQISACSSAPPIKKQAYAQLNQEQTFEYDFATVWKGIEESLRKHKVADRDPAEVSINEFRKLTRRTLETDWTYGQSRDKYQEYQVNGSPRKVYLQTRFKYFLDARSVMGGVNVKVTTQEEVEQMKSDGTSSGFKSADPDSSRSRELIDRILLSIRSAAP